MPKQNPYLIKENYKQVEEVREIENKELITPEEQAKLVDKLVKNEIPSYEEFMKTYQEDEGAVDNYYYEIDSYGDIRIVRCYGPGFGSWITKVAITTTAGILLGPAAIPVGAAVWGGSRIAEECCDNENDRKVFSFISDIGRDTLTGGAIGVASQSVGAVAGFNKFVGLGKNCEGALNSAIHGIKVAGTIEFWTSKGFEAKDAIKHIAHKDNGIEYKVGCNVCES
jgi:hypothetical protein